MFLGLRKYPPTTDKIPTIPVDAEYNNFQSESATNIKVIAVKANSTIAKP